ncbi:hypothetical protein NR798_35250 [Archangium gephyra]|uniref:hypothetical protein n=1 Tax=Archangium gephyra TaxID=48 RepID=UPI0035D472E2
MKDSTQKKEAIIQKEPIVSFEIIELDDTVLGSIAGGYNSCMNNCGPYKMK